jgi:hypothetical protein
MKREMLFCESLPRTQPTIYTNFAKAMQTRHDSGRFAHNTQAHGAREFAFQHRLIHVLRDVAHSARQPRQLKLCQSAQFLRTRTQKHGSSVIDIKLELFHSGTHVIAHR